MTYGEDKRTDRLLSQIAEADINYPELAGRLSFVQVLVEVLVSFKRSLNETKTPQVIPYQSASVFTRRHMYTLPLTAAFHGSRRSDSGGASAAGASPGGGPVLLPVLLRPVHPAAVSAAAVLSTAGRQQGPATVGPAQRPGRRGQEAARRLGRPLASARPAGDAGC